MAKIVNAGDKLPYFQVLVEDGKEVSPDDFIGKKLIIYFYPKDNTPGCTAEAKDFAAAYNEFKNLGVEILGVSKDSLKSHANFAKKYDLPFSLASDPEGEMCNIFGVWVEKSMYGRKYMGIERSTFLINEEGIILKIWRKVSVTNHINEVLKEVKK